MKNIEIVAHRGVHNGHPENTIPAFEKAIVQGADAVELDVRLTADRIPVVFHYFYLNEITSLTGPVFSFTYDQLKQARFINTASRDIDVCIPVLEEVLEIFSGRIGLEIEIKGPEPEAAEIVGTLLNEYKHLWENMELTSYEPMTLVKIREHCPSIVTDLLIPLSEPWMGPDVLTYQVIQRARMAGAQAVHLHPTQLSRQVVKEIRHNGLEVHAWDVNTEGDWKTIHSLNIPKVNTDNLELALKVSGRWLALSV